MSDSTAGRLKSSLKQLVFGRWASVPDPYRHPQVRIGRHTYGLSANSVRIYSPDDRVDIGAFCSISRDVRIIAGGERYADRVSTFGFWTHLMGGDVARDVPRREPLSIGHDVWIGTGATILPGTRIGTGAIVAAGALVRGVVEEYAVVGGVPGRVIKHRFEPAQREALLRIAWWDWSDEVLRERVEFFYGSVDAFIAQFDVPLAAPQGGERVSRQAGEKHE